MEKKVRFRLHKVKKHWVTLTVSTLALALTLAGGNSVQAEEISVTDSAPQVVSVDSTKSSGDISQSQEESQGEEASAAESVAGQEQSAISTASVSEGITADAKEGQTPLSEDSEIQTSGLNKQEELTPASTGARASENVNSSTVAEAAEGSDQSRASDVAETPRRQFLSDEAGNWYYYDADGQKVTGPQTIDSFHLYFYQDGVQAKNALVEREGKKYYYDADDGRLVTNLVFDYQGKSYTADASGVLTENPQYRKQFVSDDQGNWYYYDANGQKLTGFQTVDGVKLYFKEDGKQAKGELVTVDGYSYYLDKDSGALAANQEIDFGLYGRNKVYKAYRYFDADGKMVTGWLDRDGQRYYYDKNGVKVLDVANYNHNVADRDFIPGLFGTTVDYQFDAQTGAMYRNAFAEVYGFSPEDPAGTRYPSRHLAYFGEDGKAVSGWQEINGQTYYFYPESKFRMGFGLRSIDGKLYYFQPGTNALLRQADFELNGKFYTADDAGVVTEKPQYRKQFVSDDQGNWYYYDANGQKLTGFQTVDGVSLYFDKDGRQAKGKLVNIEGESYYFDPDSGEMFRDGSKEINGQTYYFATDGSMLHDQFYTVRMPGRNNDYTLYLTNRGEVYKQGVVTLSDDTYYFFPDSGHMAKGRTLIGEEAYYFDPVTGKLLKNQLIASTVTSVGPMYAIYYYLADSEGRLQTGWQTVDGETYYFMPPTAADNQLEHYRAASIVKEIDGKYYLFDGQGRLKRNYTGKVSYSGRDAFDKVVYSSDYKTDAEGVLQKGLFEVNGNIYYFNYAGYTLGSPSGKTKDPWQVIDGQLYHFKYEAPGYNMAPLSRNVNVVKDGKIYHLDENGHPTLLDIRNQFISDEDHKWYYFDADGTMLTGFQTINGQHLYFYEDGKQAKGRFVNIDGKSYYFDPDSGEKWVNRKLVTEPAHYVYVFDADGVATQVSP
ncbi:KxYKxGKxW signal peptide domain-containing protein [Streptococcus sp. DD12]|uniref:KxYKxGKxW signal peptide domain-containing protein n=1 Tax=Streptococcus sp. DD12 TaxID=1777880 RepID=UPI000793F377|nr:KxYKxGKxW signal peptide domain-containing protein [Streptococcus sp. DD12]KXT76445.1 Choline binding protein A [Streptococcus sp. DD12]